MGATRTVDFLESLLSKIFLNLDRLVCLAEKGKPESKRHKPEATSLMTVGGAPPSDPLTTLPCPCALAARLSAARPPARRRRPRIAADLEPRLGARVSTAHAEKIWQRQRTRLSSS